VNATVSGRLRASSAVKSGYGRAIEFSSSRRVRAVSPFAQSCVRADALFSGLFSPASSAAASNASVSTTTVAPLRDIPGNARGCSTTSTGSVSPSPIVSIWSPSRPPPSSMTGRLPPPSVSSVTIWASGTDAYESFQYTVAGSVSASTANRSTGRLPSLTTPFPESCVTFVTGTPRSVGTSRSKLVHPRTSLPVPRNDAARTVARYDETTVSA
jgi:hypothetical protein